MNLTVSPSHLRPGVAAGLTPRRHTPESDGGWDRSELIGATAGGLAGGLGLGYLGMSLGVRWGVEYGMNLALATPLPPLAGLVSLGLPYAVLGAMAGGTAGVLLGVGLGMWLGRRAARCLSERA
ncbi:MAG: hypothetical protein AB1758_35360 [Candidatus Eremiobacterota bacterium]